MEITNQWIHMILSHLNLHWGIDNHHTVSHPKNLLKSVTSGQKWCQLKQSHSNITYQCPNIKVGSLTETDKRYAHSSYHFKSVSQNSSAVNFHFEININFVKVNTKN